MPQKTIAQKLFVKEGDKVLFLNQPEDYISIIGDLPKNVDISSEAEGDLNVIQVFVENKSDLEVQLPLLIKKMKDDGKLWLSYHKGTSKTKTDINRDTLREYALSIGLKAVGMISINKDWSAMRFKKVE